MIVATRVELEAFGGPEVLRLVEFDAPAPGPGELLVHNRALGVNPFDGKVISGAAMRGKEVTFPIVPGNEGAGVVEAVGEGVDDFAVGDAVLWNTYLGGYASHRLVPIAKAWHKPAVVSFEQAAVLAVAGATAYSAVTQVGVGEGDTLLIHGAAGGVGSAGIQIARSLGARIIGTCSAANDEYVRSLGAEPVRYGEGLADRVAAMGTVTAVADFAGSPDAMEATTKLLPDLTRAVTTARDGVAYAQGVAYVKTQPDSTGAMLALAASGALTLEISRQFPLSEVAAAVELSSSGHVRGKIVLLP
jgi:NADPH:quinone reductase-like Zn-dependent oxidoreductase